MKSLILITGFGRSGTSLLAACFKEAGFKIPNSFYPGSRHGFELDEINQINERIAKGEYVDPKSVSELVRDYDVLKDPRFSATIAWWVKNFLVKESYFCLRNVDSVQKSAISVSKNWRRHWLYKSKEKMYERFCRYYIGCLENGVKPKVLLYPQSFESCERLKQCGVPYDVSEALRTVIRREWFCGNFSG